LGSGNAECGKNKEDRVLNWDFGMRNGRKQNAEVGMRSAEWESIEQRTDGRSQSFEFGMRKAEGGKKKRTEF
jgi:hypothetical protein